MKLWHDDIRKAPEGWTWARTNDEAMKLLRENEVEEASLDHDLGFENADPDAPFAAYQRGTSLETGFDLVEQMIAEDLVPPKVRIHSWNYHGAQRMAARLNRYTSSEVRIAPYSIKEGDY